MADRYRIGIVGASSMLGKEIGEELANSAFAAATVLLLDDADAEGQVTAVGEEAAFIQKIAKDSFDGLDFVFFAGTRAVTEAQWSAVRAAGALVIDATYALEGESEALVWSAGLGTEAGQGRGAPDLQTSLVVLVHPVAMLLGQVAERLRETGLTEMVVTLLQPASEYGRAAMDELHQQTVSLLSFQELPKETFDAQSAFNLLAEFGEEAGQRLEGTRKTVVEHYGRLTGEGAPRLALQVLQAPVFHGYGLSAYLRFGGPVDAAAVRERLGSAQIEVVSGDAELPNNVSAAGQAQALARVADGVAGADGVWLWLAADNLKLAATEAVGTAVALRRVRPSGQIQ